MKSFTIPEVEQKYGIRKQVVSELVKEGFVCPARGRRREYRFTFRDVVMMRMAQDLYALGISPRKTTRFLQKLRRELPDASVVGLRVSAAGRELVVREDGRLRNAEGQLVIEFADKEPAALSKLPAPPHPRVAGDRTADEWHHAALLLEESDPIEAIECYRRAIEIDHLHVDAYVNLGCLLINAAQYVDAYAVLQEGAAQCRRHPLLQFNLGIANEELDRPQAALACYDAALTLDPTLADAHFNAARLHESMGHRARAIRHYNAYRKLTH